MILRKVASGAYIDFNQINAIYANLPKGTKDLDIYAVVNGIDILIKRINVKDKKPEEITKIVDEYVKHLSALSTESRITGGFGTSDVSDV